MQMYVRGRAIYSTLLNVYAVKYARRTGVHREAAFSNGRRGNCSVRRRASINKFRANSRRNVVDPSRDARINGSDGVGGCISLVKTGRCHPAL